MRIEARYEIGQEVWVLFDSGVVRRGTLMSISIDHDGMKYLVESLGRWYHPAADVFPTQAEAQAEAEKRYRITITEAEG